MHTSTTSITLLNRIRANREDETAWRDFVKRYGTRIYQWCQNRKLQPNDAEDVTQDVLLKLAIQFEKFEYDPNRSFRGWLRRVTENAVTDFARSRASRNSAQGGSEVNDLLAEEPARQELWQYLSEAFDLEIFDEAKFQYSQ